jgi:hypothetical protein
MSQLGQSQAIEAMAPASALPPTSDIGATARKCRQVPIATESICSKKRFLFDNLVGKHEQVVWNGYAECNGGLEVDH